jgi:uncharacterized protein
MIAETTTQYKSAGRGWPASQRLLDVDSLPVTGNTITTIDLDLTVRCNLACDYCFKEKTNADMSLTTAQDAVCWLIFASMDARRLLVNLIGGEPLLRFDLIKQLVPFAKRRAFQHNKSIHFGLTTNGTILTEEIIEFWRHWGIGFHTSIDGCPAAHNLHRHFPDGRPSSFLLERNLPKILALRPKTTARATVLPDTVKYLAQSFDYLIDMGYRSVAFVTGSYSQWSTQSVEEFREQFRLVLLRVVDMFHKGIFIKLKFFDEGCASLAGSKKSQIGGPACGAGRGTVLIDVNGDIWPCHRWSKKREKDWRLGSIYQPTFNYESREFINSPKTADQIEDCRKCPASFICSGGCPAENLEDTDAIYNRHKMGCALAAATAELVREFHDTLFSEKNPVFMKTYYKNAPAKEGRDSK